MSIEFEKESVKYLEGVCDLHIYSGPDVYARQFDIIHLARQCREVGYRAIVYKTHLFVNADAAALARKCVPGIEIYGGVVLNWAVGGLNPHAVDASIRMGGKIVWMPNMHSANQMKLYKTEADWFYAGQPVRKGPPITILDEEGKVLSVVYEILDLIADADVILNTGHLSIPECFALVEAAKSSGVNKILVNHPSLVPGETGIMGLLYWSLEDAKKITALGANLELNCPRDRSFEPKFVEYIKEVGPERCVIASGQGAINTYHPIEAMRVFLARLHRKYGISLKDIDLMTKDTPAKLLGLE